MPSSCMLTVPAALSTTTERRPCVICRRVIEWERSPNSSNAKCYLDPGEFFHYCDHQRDEVIAVIQNAVDRDEK